MYGVLTRLFVGIMMALGAIVVLGLVLLAAADANRPLPQSIVKMGHSR